jgi:hypothetical protein
MRDITNLVGNWRKYLQKDCPQGCGTEGTCKSNFNCTRMKMAEVWAYRDAVIPNEYRNFTISDFTGFKDKKRLLKDSVAGKASMAIKKYCWNDIDEGEEYDPMTWLEKSAMPHRRSYGTNMCIYGNPWTSDSSTGVAKPFRQPLGRTMLASIVLKEAINLRLLPGSKHLSDRYGWISYHQLTTMLMEKANGRKDFDDDIWHHETADWLVLDGLELRKDAGMAFRASVLDQFFIGRSQGYRPTILVFQDDISKFNADELRDHYGTHVSSHIVNSSKTHHVALLDK